MNEISTDLIKEAVYNLCFEANTCLSKSVYSKLLNSYKKEKNAETKNILGNVLLNVKTAYEKKRPLCQDTGQVIVFFEIGQNVSLKGEYIETAINSAIEKCYKEKFFRKSVVENAVFNRTNTNTNTPAIIHTKIINGDKINIKILIKGAGSENKSKLKMMLPTTERKEIIERIGELIINAEVNACPPMFIGIGFGGSAEKAFILSKEAFFDGNLSKEEKTLANDIKKYVNKKAKTVYENSYVEDVKIMTSATHIACMPVAITINCHSDRFSSCTIGKKGIIYHHKKPDFAEIKENCADLKEISTTDINTVKSLKEGEEILLSGELYVARDMAHKRMSEMIKKGEKLPFETKNKIILYAGPCPKKENEITGSIGPTTAERMDGYAIELYNKGLLGTIGKGQRSLETKRCIQKNGGKYFTLAGGIAALLSEKVTKSEIVAFEELGAEAIYRIEVKRLPVRTEIA